METPGIHIETVWRDEDMLEFRLAAANEFFCGSALCYVSLDEAI
jgi:hypothetical protein